MEEIKRKYIKLFAKYSKVAPDSVDMPLPFDSDLLEELTIEWYKIQLERFRKDQPTQNDDERDR